MTYFLETYGCQMNVAESAALVLELEERHWTAAANAEAADLVVLNTCSVRATAEQRAFGRIAHYSAEKKKRRFTLIVAGCMAERLKAGLQKDYAAVDYVVGTSARTLFPSILEAIANGQTWVPTDEKPVFAFSGSHLEAGAFRSFVPIMHGCNNFCTYCIVPYVRGREVSRSPRSIRQEIRLLADRGVREITLLGQNVNSYLWTEDGGTVDFPALLELVAREVEGTPIRWVRFLSSHPKDLSSRAIAALAADPVFCRHIHLCVQHGSDRVLAAMNRRYTRARYLELIAELRAALPGLSLTTDILIGFPGETEDDVAATLDLMDRIRFQNAYMYHYNPREGTAAYSLPDRIPEPVKRERLARIIAAQQGHTRELMRARVGQQARVLVEGVSRNSADELLGRTERDEMVVFRAGPEQIGTFVDLELSALRGHTFRAKESQPCPCV